jgi:glycosyltransferase involved in cell wall biosynthesis
MLALLVARLADIEFSFTTHAYDIFLPNRTLLWKTRQARFMRTISEFNRRYLQERLPEVDWAKVRVCHLGVDTQCLAACSRIGSNAHIVSVGSLIRKKGHETTIGALQLLANADVAFRAEIIGGGPQSETLHRQIEGSGLAERILLSGWLPHAQVLEHVARGDIFVLPCIDLREEGEHMDGIPVALMEAMALELPVVSTRLSGIPELIEHGVSGLLVPERDERALAGSLARLLGDPELRASLGRAARRRVEQHFDLSSNVARLAALFADRE